jgi:hypothetical protein
MSAPAAAITSNRAKRAAAKNAVVPVHAPERRLMTGRE